MHVPMFYGSVDHSYGIYRTSSGTVSVTAFAKLGLKNQLIDNLTGSLHHPRDWVSHVHCVSFSTCRPILRRKAIPLYTPVSSRHVTGLNKLENLPTDTCVTTLNWVHLMLRPAPRLKPFGPLSLGFSQYPDASQASG